MRNQKKTYITATQYTEVVFNGKKVFARIDAQQPQLVKYFYRENPEKKFKVQSSFFSKNAKVA